MKQINKIILSGFFMAIVFSFFGLSVQSENLKEDLIRLHVKANSNTNYDQNIKLMVKDEVSLFTQTLMDYAESLEDAQKIIHENLDEIQDVANQKLQQLNVNYTAKASLEYTYFGTREYDTFTLPAGTYQALKVDLGEAQGENWWCVAYPSLCTGASIKDIEKIESMLSQEEIETIENTPKYSFKIYEIYMSILEFFKGEEENVTIDTGESGVWEVELNQE